MDDLTFMDDAKKGDVRIIVCSTEGTFSTIYNVDEELLKAKCPAMVAGFQHDQRGTSFTLENKSPAAVISLLRYLYLGDYTLCEAALEKPCSIFFHFQLYQLADMFELPELKEIIRDYLVEEAERFRETDSPMHGFYDGIRFLYTELRKHLDLRRIMAYYCIMRFDHFKFGQSETFRQTVYESSLFHRDLQQANSWSDFAPAGALEIVQLPLCNHWMHSEGLDFTCALHYLDEQEYIHATPNKGKDHILPLFPSGANIVADHFYTLAKSHNKIWERVLNPTSRKFTSERVIHWNSIEFGTTPAENEDTDANDNLTTNRWDFGPKRNLSERIPAQNGDWSGPRHGQTLPKPEAGFENPKSTADIFDLFDSVATAKRNRQTLKQMRSSMLADGGHTNTPRPEAEGTHPLPFRFNDDSRASKSGMPLTQAGHISKEQALVAANTELVRTVKELQMHGYPAQLVNTSYLPEVPLHDSSEADHLLMKRRRKPTSTVRLISSKEGSSSSPIKKLRRSSADSDDDKMVVAHEPNAYTDEALLARFTRSQSAAKSQSAALQAKVSELTIRTKTLQDQIKASTTFSADPNVQALISMGAMPISQTSVAQPRSVAYAASTGGTIQTSPSSTQSEAQYAGYGSVTSAETKQAFSALLDAKRDIARLKSLDPPMQQAQPSNRTLAAGHSPQPSIAIVSDSVSSRSREQANAYLVGKAYAEKVRSSSQRNSGITVASEPSGVSAISAVPTSSKTATNLAAAHGHQTLQTPVATSTIQQTSTSAVSDESDMDWETVDIPFSSASSPSGRGQQRGRNIGPASPGDESDAEWFNVMFPTRAN